MVLKRNDDDLRRGRYSVTFGGHRRERSRRRSRGRDADWSPLGVIERGLRRGGGGRGRARFGTNDPKGTGNYIIDLFNVPYQLEQNRQRLEQARLGELQRYLEQAGPPPDFANQFAVDLPGVPDPILAPLPDKDPYMAPFNRAELIAHDTYNQARPVIGNIYDDLEQALTQRQGEARQEGRRTRQAAAREQQALRAQSQALTAPTALGESLGGTPGADQQAEADRAFMALQQADQTGLARDMENAAVADSEARLQDAEGMRSGSLANARNNLDQILSQIGIGRSEAERQFLADTQQVNLANTQALQQNAEAKRQHAILKQQMQSENMQLAQQAEQMWAERNERAAAAAMQNGRMRWEQNMERRQASNPMASTAMLDLIDGAGEGATGKARALAKLDELFPKGKPARLTDPETGEPLYGGKRLNPAVIRDWVREYYDQQDTVDPKAYSVYGGDPTYLAVRHLYANANR